MCVHGWVAFVTIFNPAQVAPIIFRIFKEGNKITDTDHINRRLESIALVYGRRKHHIATVTAAIDNDPLGI